MKKIFLLFSLIALVLTGYGQSGATCSTAKMFDTTGIGESQTQQAQWYQFMARNSTLTIYVKGSIYGKSDKINKINMYGGTCVSLYPYASDTATSSNDSIFSVSVTELAIGTTYYLKISKGNSTTTINYTVDIEGLAPPDFCPAVDHSCQLISNGDFGYIYTGTGSSSVDPFANGDVCYWQKASQTPQANTGAGATTPGYAFMWCKSSGNEAIQTQVTVTSGQKYVLSYYYRKDPTLNGSGVIIPSIVVKLGNSQTIDQVNNISTTTWTKRTICFTANNNYTTLQLYPQADITINNPVWINFDDVSLQLFKAEAGPDVATCGLSRIIGTSCSINGATYSWSPSTGLSCGNCAQPTASPASTTLYTLTVTAPGGCTATDQVLVTVASPTTVTASASPSTIVSGNASQLTASPSTGLTYSWQPSASLNNPTIYNPLASPTLNTNYTLTATNASGCTTTTTVGVAVITPACNISTYSYTVPLSGGTTSAITSFFGGSTLVSNRNILVLGPLSVDNNVTFFRCNIVMDAGIAINLTTGNLTLSGSTHIYSCSDMWDGIYVPSGRTLTVQGNSFIEDAINAVVSTGGGVYTINTAIFNKNLIAVDVRTTGTHTGTIINSIITCRNLPGDLFPVNNKTVALLKTTDPLTNYQPVVLRGPYSNRKGFCGVNVTDVTSLNIGSASASGNLNIFDNIMCGINLTRSNATIYNNKFQYLLGYNDVTCPSPPAPCYYDTGNGIRATGTANTGTNSITVGGIGANQANTFIDTYLAINILRYKTQNVVGNSISNSTTGPHSTGFLNYGKIGISVSAPTASNVINVSNQTLIKNCETGIWVNRNNNNALNTTTLTINNNGSTGNPCITADANGYCTTGIYITDLLNGTTTAPTTWEINNNVISETKNCISLSNVKRSALYNNYNILTNSMTVRYASTGAINGIKAVGCSRLNISNNHVKCNSSAAAQISPQGNILTYGIYLQNSVYMHVKCNQVDNMARSLVFDGICTSDSDRGNLIGILQNKMYNAQDGLVLLSPSTTIGRQGGDSGNMGSDNIWDVSSTFSNSQTFSNATNTPTTTQLQVNAGAATVPTVNKGNIPLPSTNGISVIGGGPPVPDCGFIPALVKSSNSWDRNTDTEYYANSLKNLLQDSTKFSLYNEEIHWQRKRFAYDIIRKNTALTDDNAFFRDFFNKNVTTGVDRFSQIDEAIVSGNYEQANAVNNSIMPSNVAESNQQAVNSLILQGLINPSYIYSKSDIATLNSIGNQCPVQVGNSVYQARNLLMTLAGEILEFEDNCSSELRSGEEITGITRNIYEEKFKLYPNPNNGTMTIDYNLNPNDKAEILIYDLTGKLISRNLINASSNRLTINETELKAGIYFYQINLNKTIAKQDKIIIVK